MRWLLLALGLIWGTAASAATLSLPPVVVTGTSGNCSHSVAGLNDGCAAAVPIAPNYPPLLAVYGGNRPPWSVAGVDYGVGAPPGMYLDPQTAALPAGCTLSGLTVSCVSPATGISGYDFTLHGGMKLVTNAAGFTIKGNKFALAPNCADPSLTVNTGGSIINNSFDGGGATCKILTIGGIINSTFASGTTPSVLYNLFTNVPQDAFDTRGPGSGSAGLAMRYNMIYMHAWLPHADGLQTCGGNFNGIDVSFNTYWTQGTPRDDAQPLHVEAQCSSVISNVTVNHNTIMALGTCKAGANWPTGCVVNYEVACKQDNPPPPAPPVNFLTNYSANGNYFDPSGAVAALSNAYGCPSATFGTTSPNMDMTTGKVIPAP